MFDDISPLLVIEDTAATMAPWRATIDDFLARLAKVRSVTRGTLTTDLDQVELHAEDPNGRQVLVVSDMVSQSWDDGRMATVVRELGPAVAFVQVLPSRLWHRTGLDSLRAPHGRLPTGATALVPVWTLKGEQAAMAAFVAPEETDPEGFSFRAVRESSEVVSWFGAVSSLCARQVAVVLAASPHLDVELMFELARRFCPEADASHLAEVFMGGLLRMAKGEYVFREGVRERLLDRAQADVCAGVLEMASDHVQSKCGHAFSFRTVLADPTVPVEVPAAERQFAAAGFTVLARFGGLYREAALAFGAMERP
jgi:hypothetical protein